MRIMTEVQLVFPLSFLTIPSKKRTRFKAGDHSRKRHLSFGLLGLLAALLLPGVAEAIGTWTALATAPPTGVNNSMVLSDGTVIGMNGSGQCVKLTPNSSGSYINGTWTTLQTMNYSRLFYASQVLTNGNIFVAGGEYGTGNENGEVYNPLANTWTVAPATPGVDNFLDAISEILPNGNVLVAPVGPSTFGGTLIWNAASSTWLTGPTLYRGGSQDEASWVLLPDTSILTIDPFGQNSERYIPSLNEWINDATVPVQMYNSALGEIGAGFLLPNGNAFFLGGTDNTAIYTPTGTTSPGSWAAGANIPNGYGVSDGPAAMLTDGNILCCVGNSSNYNGPAYFYEYNYVSNTFTPAPSPTSGTAGASYNSAPFGTSMLDLPDGNVLFIGGQNSGSLYVYTPGGTPLAAGKPVISSISENADGSYSLTGTGLNGISQGAAYGDDEQMNSNYPLVRMTNSSTGNVYYARTFNWNSTGVMTGAKVVTTQFSLPANLPAATYSLVVVANGNPSAAQTFTYAPPPVPTGLTAASGSNAFASLKWNASTGAAAYNLKRSSTSGGYFSTIATLSGLAFTNTGLTNGLTYYYKVAAIGSGGPSSDSAAVSAIPAGPPLIPGATNVSLTAYYNRTGIYTDGHAFSGGLDGGGYAFSANLTGPSVFWNNLVFDFGPSNAADVVDCAGQTITLPAGRFNSLQILATGVDGSQTAQTFTVTYTDNSTATFTQSFSDWANPQLYPGEFTVLTMPYRDAGSGGEQALDVTVDAYVFTLNQTKTARSITLPNNSDLVLLSMMLANDPVSVPLSSYYDRAGIYTDGNTFTNPATGGLDGGGEAYSGTLLGNSQTWSNILFAFGPLNATNVVSCSNQTITLPSGNYSRLWMLATGVEGDQTSQSFLVTYSDSTTASFTQSFSDWFTPQSYAGESKAVTMSHRNNSDGSADNSTFYLYGYSFALNNAKIVQSIQVPNDANVVILAISLVPNWPPTFSVNPFTLPKVNAGQLYSASIATNASDLNGDALTFAKVSGPAWLSVAANGTVSGTPASSNAGTNAFVVSVTDTGGLSSLATLDIDVIGAPSFTVNPFTMPAIVAGQNYSGTIATNATDPNPGAVPVFAKVSGSTWLAVATNGALAGTPLSANVGNNSFVVSVTDSGGLSNTATMNIAVTAAPPIFSTISAQAGGLQLTWSGGVGPYQVQESTNLANTNWQDVGGTISSNSLSITPSNSATFYRIFGQ
jgi:hypothetical protein